LPYLVHQWWVRWNTYNLKSLRRENYVASLDRHPGNRNLPLTPQLRWDVHEGQSAGNHLRHNFPLFLNRDRVRDLRQRQGGETDDRLEISLRSCFSDHRHIDHWFCPCYRKTDCLCSFLDWRVHLHPARRDFGPIGPHSEQGGRLQQRGR
jgi:hypothetical protein